MRSVQAFLTSGADSTELRGTELHWSCSAPQEIERDNDLNAKQGIEGYCLATLFESCASAAAVVD